jgi:hypothetical protein
VSLCNHNQYSCRLVPQLVPQSVAAISLQSNVTVVVVSCALFGGDKRLVATGGVDAH